jgi:hypothetical protein
MGSSFALFSAFLATTMAWKALSANMDSTDSIRHLPSRPVHSLLEPSAPPLPNVQTEFIALLGTSCRSLAVETFSLLAPPTLSAHPTPAFLDLVTGCYLHLRHPPFLQAPSPHQLHLPRQAFP